MGRIALPNAKRILAEPFRYPWYVNSTGVSLLANGTTGSAVIAGNVELWDGLGPSMPGYQLASPTDYCFFM